LDIVNAVKGPKGLKKEYFQKEYIKTRGIHPIYNSNFNMIGPFLTSLDCPKILEKTGLKDPKWEIFKK